MYHDVIPETRDYFDACAILARLARSRSATLRQLSEADAVVQRLAAQLAEAGLGHPLAALRERAYRAFEPAYGDALCEECGRMYLIHPTPPHPADAALHLLCDGTMVQL